jgi:hypothetical protein
MRASAASARSPSRVPSGRPATVDGDEDLLERQSGYLSRTTRVILASSSSGCGCSTSLELLVGAIVVQHSVSYMPETSRPIAPRIRANTNPTTSEKATNEPTPIAIHPHIGIATFDAAESNSFLAQRSRRSARAEVGLPALPSDQITVALAVAN